VGGNVSDPDERQNGEEDAPRPESESVAPPSPLAKYRILFAIVWIGVQVGLIVTSDHRVDGAFGFRMFNESSTIKLALYRELDNKRVHVEGGVWTARSADDRIHRITWYDRVPMPYWIFDQEMSASYGAKTQIARLQGALDEIAANTPHDAETRRFILDVTIRRNGREPQVVHLESRERAVSVAGGNR
jgi:hypothetical protein